MGSSIAKISKSDHSKSYWVTGYSRDSGLIQLLGEFGNIFEVSLKQSARSKYVLTDSSDALLSQDWDKHASAHDSIAVPVDKGSRPPEFKTPLSPSLSEHLADLDLFADDGEF